MQLLKNLQSGQGQDADGLAAECGVSRRTVFRDLATLRSSGVPLEFDADSERYFIPTDFFLPSTNFTAEEALAVIALAGQLGGRNQLPFYEPARRAALKIESNLPHKLREEVDALSRLVQIDLKQVNQLEGMNATYHQLGEAITHGRVMKITYDSLTEWEKITTRLRPYRLLFNKRSWFVIGRSSMHREVRTFNVSRINSIEPTKQTYKIPRNFNLEEYLGNAWNMIPDEGPDHQVVIHFLPLVAQNVAEVSWHLTQETRYLADGSLEFRAQVSGLNEISWWVLGYGDQAEVVKPARLRKLVAQRAANMHAIYNGSK